MPELLTFCGRTFTAGELELMRQITVEFSALGVTEISRTVCELLEWKRPNGGLKNHECRQLLERLAAAGHLQLPALRKRGGWGPRRADVSAPCLDPVPRDRHRELACLLWTSPAWKMQARDAWVGWSDEQRQRNLQSIVNNGRFLILPWVRIQGLASKILALSARQMPQEWETRFGHRPLLLETLVDAARFRGTCYRAANWLHVGQTAGRGRMDREHKAHGRAVKDVYVYPLVRDARQRLCGDLTR